MRAIESQSIRVEAACYMDIHQVRTWYCLLTPKKKQSAEDEEFRMNHVLINVCWY